jgi:outer membrane protein OmpA-like peptidoglycan-associated protein
MRASLLFLMAAVAAAQDYPIQRPNGTWQKPGEIQQPKGPWQTPGMLQAPKGIQAIRTQDEKCQRRLIVGADALFEFNKATLTPDAIETLNALGPLVRRAGKHPVTVEGHTDAIGSPRSNQELSERRAEAVRAWLTEQHYVDAASLTAKGFGKTRPIAPNRNPDGSDSPEGRQKNRRVELVIDNCQ